ncbi:hypothetical protein WN48_00938 [Eufriesea mexicana]|uniref:Uncharacterized protein n=1 Tax=Eufriesea mexicana TaxID=516756 RepID=A0A310SQM6_9HYME|nr:hypothetical protein WN48_00938 [Eufriesea mexicana]
MEACREKHALGAALRNDVAGVNAESHIANDLSQEDPEYYLGLDIQTIGVGSLDLNNGSRWHTDVHTIVHRPIFVHPKNLDSMLLNYERDLFEDLNSLGRYNRINSGLNDIHAYLLNIEESARDIAIAGPSISLSTDPTRNMTSPDPSNSTQNPDEPTNTAELTQELLASDTTNLETSRGLTLGLPNQEK